MASVDLSTRECDGQLVIALRGELDAIDAPSVAGALERAMVRTPGIIIDLAVLEFIDCAGLWALAGARAQARRAGGDLLLAAPQRLVLRILTLTGLADSFSIHPSVEQAADSARRSRPADPAAGTVPRLTLSPPPGLDRAATARRMQVPVSGP